MAGVRISSRAHCAMLAAADAAHPFEACGLLLGEGGRVDDATLARNVAEAPATRFEIDPAHLLAAHRAARAGGPAILGWWHSHPSGLAEPSATDAAMSDPDGRVWAIVAAGQVRTFRALAAGPLHGRFVAIEWAIDPE